MPRGGRRNGKSGEAYSNRSDLATQPVRTAPGQPYGAAGKQAAAQRDMPLPASPQPSTAAPASSAAPFAPPASGLLSAPTNRPAEPVTAGLPIGAGPGPEAMTGASTFANDNDQALMGLYRAFQAEPNDALRRLIAIAEAQRGVGR